MLVFTFIPQFIRPCIKLFYFANFYRCVACFQPPRRTKHFFTKGTCTFTQKNAFSLFTYKTTDIQRTYAYRRIVNYLPIEFRSSGKITFAFGKPKTNA